ncbi:MAG: TetR/AcrR family transcriptional regulator [Dermatophilus congolensis]|nr:TetR/AcrR family transcriptional regulator [Dermatophilus congolensis]
MSRVPAEQRREQLIEATIDLAIEEGLAAASVRRIADRANVSLGVVHYCFNSKEALLNGVAESFATPILGPVAAAIEEGHARGLPFRDLAVKAFHAFRDVTRKAPGRQLLSYELAAWSIRSDGEAARLLYQTYLDVIEGFLTEGMGLEGTEELPMRIVARMVLAVADGATLSWLVDRDDEATDHVIRILVEGLLKLVDENGTSILVSN